MSTVTTPPATPARPTPPRPGRKARLARHPRSFSDWAVLVALVALAAIVLVPFLLILLNAFRTPADYAANGPLSLPRELYLDGMITFWNRVNFPATLWNSFFIAGSVAILAVVISLLNAFALGVGRVRGRVGIILIFLLANMLPQEVLLYPLYIIFRTVGLYDNVWSVILTFVVIQSAFGTYLLASVFGTFPKEVLEAAAIDGAGRWRTLWQMIMPISRPTLGVLLVFFFIWTWNEFLIPLTFLVSNDNRTVPVAITVLQGDRIMDVTTTSASALLGLLPTLIFFLIFQRTLTRGITAGAVK